MSRLLESGAVPRPIVRAVLRTRDAMLRAADAIVPPQAALLDELAGVQRTVALHIVARYGIADALLEGPRTVAELAAQTGLNAERLERVMSVLIARGIFKIEGGRYANTRTSRPLAERTRGSLRAMAEYFGAAFNLRGWAALPESMTDQAGVFERANGAGIWSYLAEHGAEGRTFAAAMAELTRIDAPTLAAALPVADCATVCDVAGGRGALLAAVLSRHPKVRGILVDEPYVLEEAKATLAAHGVLDRVDRAAGNIFESVPAGHDAYLLKDILHDWSDERCVAILKTVRAAMKPSARLLVCEVPIDHGAPAFPAPIADLQMLMVCDGGKQRSPAQLAELFAAAGLSLTQTIEPPLPMAIFVGAPAQRA